MVNLLSNHVVLREYYEGLHILILTGSEEFAKAVSLSVGHYDETLK